MTKVYITTSKFITVDGETVKQHTHHKPRTFEFRHDAIRWLLTEGYILQERNQYMTPDHMNIATVESRRVI